MKKLMLFLIALIPIVLIATIEFSQVLITESAYVSVESISFEESYKEIIKSTDQPVTLEYSAKILPVAASNKQVNYYSSNTSVAIVDSLGEITFLDFGTVTITAQSQDNQLLTASCNFLVTDSVAHRIKIENKISSLIVGEVHYLSCVITPNETLDKTITYSSSNPNVATILANGKITAINGGETIISARTENGKVDEFTLSVIVPVTGINIVGENYLTTALNNVQFPDVEVLPSNATNKAVAYSSLNESLASISSTGLITFNSMGTCSFKATTLDGNYSTEFTVNFTNGYIVSASLNMPSTNLTLDYSENLTLSTPVSIYPANADSSNVIYTSSNSSVVQTGADGTHLIVGGGSASITIQIKKNETDVVTIGVVDVFVNRPCEVINVENLNITINSRIYKLNYSTLPSDHTDSISFSCSSSIASVNSNGVVTFYDEGVATIVIRANDDVALSVNINYIPSDINVLNVDENNQTFTIHYDTISNNMYNIVYNSDLNINLANLSYEIISGSDVVSYSTNFEILKGGNATIKASDGETEILINLIITKDVDDIEFSYNTDSYTSKTEVQFTANVLPTYATNQTINYSVNNTEIATISSNGFLTFKQAGEVEVSLSADEITKKVTIKSSYGTASNFSYAISNSVLEDVGETATITLSNFTPSDYSFNIANVAFNSSNTSVATVNANGVITAVDRGNAIITFNLDGIEKSIEIEVQVKTKSVNFTYNGSVINQGKIIGSSISLGYSVLPANANNTNVTFSVVSGDATITEAGLLTFSSTDTAVIRVTTLDTGVYSEISITKVDSPTNLEIYLNQIDVTNNSTFIKVLPTDSNPIFEVVITDSTLLDPENISVANINTSVTNAYTVITNNLDGTFTAYNSDLTTSVLETITFSYGETTANVTIKFYKITKIELCYDNSQDYLGLEQKHVFGIQSYLNDATSNTIPLTYETSENGKNDTLYWFTSNESYGAYNATTGTLELNFSNLSSAFAELDAQITAGTYLGALELYLTISVGNESTLANSTVTDSYTFTLVPAINVYTSNGLVKLNSKNIVLQTNFVASASDVSGSESHVIYTPTYSTDSSGDTFVNFSASTSTYTNIYSVYGNGYLVTFGGAAHVRILGSLTNVKMKLHNDDSTRQSFSYHFIINGGTKISYCSIQNFHHIYLSPYTTSQVFNFNNCVIKNALQQGFMLESASDGDNTEIYIDNCVMSNVGQYAINASNGKIYIKNRFDVYNFRASSEFSDYNSVIENAYSGSDFTNYVTTRQSDGATVANSAIVAMPASVLKTKPNTSTIYFWDESTNSYAAIDTDNESITVGDLTYTKKEASTKILFTTYYVYMWLPENNSKITPETSADESVVYRLYGN